MTISDFITRNGAVHSTLAVIGLLTTMQLAYSFVNFVSVYLKPSKLSRYLHSKDGKPAWALITGASDGIGRAFAHELAARGFNVVIHGRNPEKLAKVEEELHITYPERSVRTLIVDASVIPCPACSSSSSSGHIHDGRDRRNTPVDFDAIVESLSDINLTVLINNAGGGPANPTFTTVDGLTQSTIIANVNVNALFPLLLLSKLLPQLIRNSPALVINMGSLSDNHLPLLSSYGPSKSFTMAVAGTVAREMRLEGHDVEVLGMRVGYTSGVTHNRRPGTLINPDAGTMARAALARVGCGQDAPIGYWGHALQQVGATMLPGWAKERLFLQVMRDMRADELAQRKSD